MTRPAVLKKRPEFLRVAKGRRWHGPSMVVQYAPSLSGQATIGIGYTASRKVGGAVARNRAKRRLRAIVRELVPKSDVHGHDLVLIARSDTAIVPFEALRTDLSTALAKIAGRRS